MNVIAADVGNSSTKVVLEVGEDHGSPDPRWLDKQVFANGESLEPKVPTGPHLWSVSSVNRSCEAKLEQWVRKNRPHDRYCLIRQDQIPIVSNVASREKVGRDRLVAAFEALILNDNQGPLVVIDAGTAVTIDLVDKDQIFQGGVIFPGAGTVLKNLCSATDALPDLSRRFHMESMGDLSKNFIGKSTEEAILIGALQMQIATINHFVNSHRTSFPTITAFATGGGMGDIQDYLDQSIVLVPDLVLQGCLAIGRRILSENLE